MLLPPRLRWRLRLALVVLAVSIAGASAQAVGTFVSTGSMAVPRALHQATLLRNGLLLITGTGTPNTELYDPETGRFIPTGPLAIGRRFHSATLLQDGRVLIVGGFDDRNQSVAAAELYDPLTGTFAPAGQTLTPTAGHSAVLLPNGNVLLVGGSNGRRFEPGAPSVPPAQLYDPATGRFTLTGNYAFRYDQDPYGDAGLGSAPALLLPNGRVLIAAEPIAEIYDPETGTFTLTGRMAKAAPYLAGRSATALTDGRILLTGGEHEDYGRFADAETYAFATGAFTATGKMSIPRDSHTATLLRDGTVLVAGGEFADVVSTGQFFGGVSATTELYDATTGRFSPGSEMMSRRSAHTATLLADGRVLLTGGYTSFSPQSVTSSAELFVPDGWSAAPASAIVVKDHPASRTVAPGGSATFTVSAEGSAPLRYQWRRDGVPIAGATNPALPLNAVTIANAGDYDVVVSNATGAVTSRLARLVVDRPQPGRLTNLSVRATLDPGAALIVGAGVAGGTKRVLIRALGPALARFAVEGVVSDPRLEVHTSVNGRDTIVAANNDWAATGDAVGWRQTFAAVGAFDLPDVTSRDAAVVTTIDRTGAVHVTDASGGRGVVLVEVYDAEANGASRLVNFSARGQVGADRSLLVGFVIDGNTPRRLLLRGIGPSLATAFGVSGAASDLKLELFLCEGSRSTLFAANDHWTETGASTLRAGFVLAGAFDLPDAASRDAALVVTVPAGVYAAIVSAGGRATGEALMEVYEVPLSP